LDNSDSLIKECAKVQTQQQKQIKQLKEQIGQKNEEIEKVIFSYCKISNHLNNN